MKTITQYKCGVCGTIYADKKSAKPAKQVTRSLSKSSVGSIRPSELTLRGSPIKSPWQPRMARKPCISLLDIRTIKAKMEREG